MALGHNLQNSYKSTTYHDQHRKHIDFNLEYENKIAEKGLLQPNCYPLQIIRETSKCLCSISGILFQLQVTTVMLSTAVTPGLVKRFQPTLPGWELTQIRQVWKENFKSNNNNYTLLVPHSQFTTSWYLKWYSEEQLLKFIARDLICILCILADSCLHSDPTVLFPGSNSLHSLLTWTCACLDLLHFLLSLYFPLIFSIPFFSIHTSTVSCSSLRHYHALCLPIHQTVQSRQKKRASF